MENRNATHRADRKILNIDGAYGASHRFNPTYGDKKDSNVFKTEHPSADEGRH